MQADGIRKFMRRRAAALLLASLCLSLAGAQTSEGRAASTTLTVIGDIPSRLVLNGEDLLKMPGKRCPSGSRTEAMWNTRVFRLAKS